jgi:Fe-S cluster assembly protein SufD
MTSSPFIESLDKQFNALLTGMNGRGAHRQAAWDRFKEMGLPTRKSEEWKYTHIIPYLKADITPRAKKEDAPFIGRGVVPELKDSAYYFVNGFARFQDDDVVRSIRTYQDSIETKNPFGDPFVEMNRALATDGAFIHVKAAEVLHEVIYVPFITSTEGTAGRWLDSYVNHVRIDDEAEAHVILHHIHQNPTAENMTNFVTRVSVGVNSVLQLYLIQNLRSEAIQLNHLEIELATASKVSTHTVNWGSKLSRNSLNIHMGGEGCEAHLYGLYNLNDHHHLDNRTLVDHAVPNCMSNELYKGILDEQATSVFNGKIIVRPDAQKTNAFQANPNILLSNEATINSKPQLEIFADDVKCTHGATVGHLDEDAMFYLRSRGLGHNNARHMLIQAFAEEVIEKIGVEPLRTYLSNQLDAELQIP